MLHSSLPSQESPMLRDFSVQALFMGALAAFVGFASSLAVVLHGLQAVGATDAQAASGLMALAISMLAGVLIGLCFAPARAIAFNPKLGLPIVLAWIAVGAFKRLWAVPAAL